VSCRFCLLCVVLLLLVIDHSVQVVSVHLPTDRETGVRRPFGFVEFEMEAEADSALAATSHNIGGRDVSSMNVVLHSIAAVILVRSLRH